MSRSRRVFNSGAGARRLVGVRSPSGVLVGVGGTMDRKRSAPDADSGSKLTLTFGGGGAKKKPKKKRSRRSRGEAAAAPPAVQVAADVDDDDGDDAAETNAQVELLLDAPCAPAPPSPCRSARPPAPAPLPSSRCCAPSLSGGLDVTADFTPMQLRRYEKFRRSAFARAKLKRVRANPAPHPARRRRLSCATTRRAAGPGRWQRKAGLQRQGRHRGAGRREDAGGRAGGDGCAPGASRRALLTTTTTITHTHRRRPA